MSDMQTLIHKSSMHAYDQGVSRERQRIIKLLEPELIRHKQLGMDASAHYLQEIINEIKDGKND
jgi:hypothetical protein